MSALFDERVLPGVIASVYALLLALLLFVPFVAREHRKRGELGAGTAALRFGALLYALGLVAYVLIPLPPVGPDFCAEFADVATPQTRPLATLDGVPAPHSGGDLVSLLGYDGVQQVLLNVLLFVPLGAFAVHLFGRRTAGVVLLGFAVSLFVETTQYTGIWYLYPCPYRLFDVDDLLANTTGALVGRLCVPLLRVLPGQHTGRRPDARRPVTPYRRLLGMACDTVLLWWIGGTALRIADLVQGARPSAWFAAHRMWAGAVLLWFLPAVLLLVAMLIGRGTSLGQYAVLLRTAEPGRRRPSPTAVLCRWAVGVGGLGFAQGALSAAGWSVLWLPASALWCSAHALGVLRGSDQRGLSGRAAGVIVVDGRTRGRPDEGTGRHRTGRRPGLARSAIEGEG